MRRRSAAWQSRGVASAGLSYCNDDYSSLGDVHIENACGKINRLMQTTANMMVRYSPTRENVLPMLFADDTLIKLQAVRGMVRPSMSSRSYRVTTDVDLRINFDEALVPTIESEFLCVQPERASPLLNAIEEVRAIYLQFEKVKHVLRWLNRNATAGAVRHYWPAALQLCPESPALKELSSVPTRFATPAKIGEMLQLIRDTAATVSASTLLPADAAGRCVTKLMLTFKCHTISDGIREFKTDDMSINI